MNDGAGRHRGRAIIAAIAGAVLLVAFALGACAPAPTPDATRTSAPQPAAPEVDGAEVVATFVSTVDGDTIETSAGTVRVIGIDTPEHGECGFETASALVDALIPVGADVRLTLPEGENDRDGYGRLVRYVTSPDGVDLGLAQIEAGNAVARYDSRDGYPSHPFEAEYHAAQIAVQDADGTVIPVGCAAAAPVATPEPIAAPPPIAAPEDAWWKAYSSCKKLKANTVGDPTGPFSAADPAQAAAYDWFAHRTGNNGDGDGDGLACEG